MRIDEPAFDATTFTKNRKRRLLEHEVADKFFAAIVHQAKLRRYVWDHFSVDGTLLNAWGVTQELQTQRRATV
jgi:hypothetical protein